MKRFAALFLMIAIVLTIPAYSADKVLGDVLNSHVRAYVNGAPVRSYNIGGYTYVVAEDLPEYGFSVTWNAAAMRLSVGECSGSVTSEYVHKNNSGVIPGTVAMHYYETNVTVDMLGEIVTGYNIGGFTCICLDDIYRLYGGDYVWNGETFEVSLTVKPGASAQKDAGMPDEPEMHRDTETHELPALFVSAGPSPVTQSASAPDHPAK